MRNLIFLALFLSFSSTAQVEKNLHMGMSIEGGYTKFGWASDLIYQISEGINTYNVGVSFNFNRNYRTGFPLVGLNTAWMIYFVKDRTKKLKPFFQLKYKVYMIKSTCFIPDCKDRISSFHELFGGFGVKYYAAKGLFLIGHIDLGMLIDYKFNGFENKYETRIQLNPMLQIGAGYDF